MKTRLMKATLVAGLLLLGGVGSAFAGSFTFNYSGLAGNSTTAQIQSYMNLQLGCSSCVTVTGAVGDYDGTSNTPYTGDGHVVGPGTGSSSSTLRQIDGGTFIINQNGLNGLSTSTDIVMTFSGITITSVSFDLEIFPDGTCPILNAANCGGAANGSGIYPNQPDFQFLSGHNTASAVKTWDGLTPGATGSYNTSWVHSPNSGSSSSEQAPQLIVLGYSTTFAASAGVNELDFRDWPATIGIQNLVITIVPEPSSLLLFGTGLLGGAGLLKRKLLG